MITGSNGQLGRALAQDLGRAPGCEVVGAVDIDEVDIAEPGALGRFVSGLASKPDVLVNAAALTQVDRCEREPELARRANVTAPGLLAELCREAGIRLVHVSTDYVFAGDGDRPYREDDPTEPRSSYGRTKLEGERRVQTASDESLVIRTSWVFGDGRNFIAAILDQARQRRDGRASGPLRVVDDQHGCPTYAVDLACAIRQLFEGGARGLFHVANEGVATWWDVARLVLDEADFSDLTIDRIGTDDLKVDAPRPTWSVLDCSKAKAQGVRLRGWPDAVRAYLASDASPLAAGNEA